MEPLELKAELARERRGVDRTLRRLLRGEKGIPDRLRRAMAHSLLAPGKRLRPLLLIWAYDALAAGCRARPVDREQALEIACGLEMLHCYSLIHDDLPAMDDDILRRGLPTCHVAFDEATAILAGDGLQALAFAIFARRGAGKAAALVEMIAGAVGPAGMVGGQQLDLDAERSAVTATVVAKIHRGKTARLLAASLAAGALLGGARPDVRERVHAAGMDLGLAFQGADDLLDVTGTTAQLGKSAGKDRDADKATWVKIEGLEKARARTRRYGRRGLATLEENLRPGPAAERLVALAGMMWNRDR